MVEFEEITDEQEESKASDRGVWKELMGNELVMRCYEQTKGAEEPGLGDYVNIEVTGYVLGSNNFKDDRDAAVREAFKGGKVFLDKQKWSLTMGDSEVTPALEMGVKFLCEGGRAYVLSQAKFAYGHTGRLGTKPCVNVEGLQSVLYDVAVVSVLSCSSDKYDTHECQIQRAAAKKVLANDCYASEWDGMGMSRALKLYSKASDMMSSLIARLPDPVPDDLKETAHQAQTLVIDCLNNVAAVHLRAKEYGKAKQACVQVIQIDQQNIKALCRAAHAAMRDPSSSYEESDAAIAAAEEVLEKLDPKDETKLFIEVRRLRHDLTARKRKYKEQQKDMSKKMFPTKEQDEDEKLAQECLKVAKETHQTENEEQQQSVLRRWWNAFLATQDIPRWERFWRNFKYQLVLMALLSLWQKYHLANLQKKASSGGDAPQQKPFMSNDVEGGQSEF
uniref:peptidylprolyl isomerase n=1 Tax=Helicotheca tamesis TaxID=374047 RepID=A0A7S2HK08_9STRA|mmetsp:Transcript_18656/g.25712  ORF Transcript_18656/g.25712 Transcript_18656/m.25712 type:complete len:447 (+) Transcript_18656:33-1373(+)